jgi:pimeloyl-ACP methyl ester carboxylesterase
MKRLALLAWVALLFALPPANIRAQDPSAASLVPRIEWDVCPFALPSSESELGTLECGYTISLENHLDPTSYEVAIAFAILYARQPDTPPAAPIIVLADRAGESILASLAGWAESPLRERRDLILFDGRGVGYSVPSLNCPELDPFAGASRIDLNGGFSSAERACYARLINENVNLTTYNSAQAAADLADLRAGLTRERGYPSYNVYGSGYGARVALTVLRDSPIAVRSVIVDSPQPMRVNLIDEQGRVVSAALARLFADCAADEACAAAYPDLANTFYTTFARLNETPITYQVIDGARTVTINLTGSGFLEIVLDAMSDSAFLPLLPLFIVRMAEGDYSVLSARPLGTRDWISEGARNAILCREEIQFNSQTNAQSYAPEFPDAIRASLLTLTDAAFATCAYWTVGESNVLETAAVFSTIPTLILSPTYDPFASPTWGALTLETLSAGIFVELRGVGHVAIDGSICAIEIAGDFLDDPTTPPDSTCAAGLSAPSFVIR